MYYNFLLEFSLFTWFGLINGKYWSDTNVYLIFLTCFTSEFLIQFIVFHTRNKNDPSKYIDNSNLLIENFYNLIVIGLLCVLVNFFQGAKFNENFLFIICICLTRFYSMCSFVNVIPYTICAYFSYLCAFGGILFSHFLRYGLNLFNNKNTKNESDYNKFTDHILKNNLNHVDFLNDDTVNKNEKKKRVSSIISALNSNTDFLNNFNTKTNCKSRRGNRSNNLMSERRTSLPTIPIKNEKVKK